MGTALLPSDPCSLARGRAAPSCSVPGFPSRLPKASPAFPAHQAPCALSPHSCAKRLLLPWGRLPHLGLFASRMLAPRHLWPLGTGCLLSPIQCQIPGVSWLRGHQAGPPGQACRGVTWAGPGRMMGEEPPRRRSPTQTPSGSAQAPCGTLGTEGQGTLWLCLRGTPSRLASCCPQQGPGWAGQCHSWPRCAVLRGCACACAVCVWVDGCPRAVCVCSGEVCV